MRLLIVNVNLEAPTLDGCLGIRRALEELMPAGHLSIVHWADVSTSTALADGWDGIILGPNETPFPAYPAMFQDFLRLVRGTTGPLLGICGGHQVLGLAYGADVVPVFDVPAPTTSYAGCPKVKGLVSLHTKVNDERILRGVSVDFDLDASHVEELRAVPEGFDIIATSALCAVQIMRHTSRPLYGIQCHPERRWSETCGQLILDNFLCIVDEARRSA